MAQQIHKIIKYDLITKIMRISVFCLIFFFNGLFLRILYLGMRYVPCTLIRKHFFFLRLVKCKAKLTTSEINVLLRSASLNLFYIKRAKLVPIILSCYKESKQICKILRMLCEILILIWQVNKKCFEYWNPKKHLETILFQVHLHQL